eukprot:5765001-Pyramimonas_sp.AAC.1
MSASTARGSCRSDRSQLSQFAGACLLFGTPCAPIPTGSAETDSQALSQSVGYASIVCTMW